MKNTSEVIKEIYKLDTKVNSDHRYLLDSTGLTIKDIRITDEGYYHGRLFDGVADHAFKDCLIQLKVYSKCKTSISKSCANILHFSFSCRSL